MSDIEEESEDDLPVLEEVEHADDDPPKPVLALVIKRVIQALTFCCALAFFLINAGVLPAAAPWVGEWLFAGVMVGLVLTIVVSFLIRAAKDRPAKSRLWLK